MNRGLAQNERRTSGAGRPQRARAGNTKEPSDVFRCSGVEIRLADALRLYASWPAPVAIVSDGPYGLAGFPGDPPTTQDLAEWYRPHAEAWAQFGTPQTTLWFWNSEIGWANVHPILEQCGWRYRCCHVWEKGKGHIAGNANSKTLRKLPVTTELCVQYTLDVMLPSDGTQMPLKDWLRSEWKRTGLPFSLTNEACGVRNAATRKYFTKDHMWYFPPPECFAAFADYANQHGLPEGRPYFSRDGRRPMTAAEWAAMRAKFDCPVGVTNVWHHPAVRGGERLKRNLKCLHTNQKPLALMELLLRISTEPDDVVWEPFGGLCTATLAASRLSRKGVAAEINPEYYRIACERFELALFKDRE